MRLGTFVMAVGSCLLLVPLSGRLAAQTQAAKPPQAATASDADEKAKILDSECWRRAMFELDQWYRTQTVFTREEVAQQRADFAAQVDRMSARELKEVVADMDAKFRILDTPQVREVRAWFGHYLSILADRRRDELLREIPNFATMTPGELNREIARFQRKKGSQRAFDRGRETQVNARLQAQSAAPPPPRRTAATIGYQSPYRPAQRERPFENVQVGTRRSMTIGPDGGVWLNMGF